MKNNNKILYISIAILVLAVGIIIGTFAYYQTTISGTISGNVAKWSFKANNQTSTFNLDLGSLYPGKTGTYTLELSAEDSDLDVYYELIFHGGSSIINDNLFFNMNSSYDINLDDWDSLEANHWYFLGYGSGNAGAYGIIPAGEKIIIPLHYNWYYGDEYTDPDDSSIADGSLASLDITIVGQQYTGYSGSIPMNILNLNIENTTYNNLTNNVIPIISCTEIVDQWGYPGQGCGERYAYYQFDAIDATRGLIRYY